VPIVLVSVESYQAEELENYLTECISKLAVHEAGNHTPIVKKNADYGPLDSGVIRIFFLI
jgi:hypothetical protein